jgi:twitching motility protein PilT
MDIEPLLRLMLQKHASDLHLTVNTPPIFRINGVLNPVEGTPSLSAEDTQKFFEQISTPQQRETFEDEFELDFTYAMANLARFRVNVMKQRNTFSLALRLVPVELPSIDGLELPQILKKLILKDRGLILVTGATGTGKSTTLAAMLNYLNQTAKRNVITIEDPIEFLFSNNMSIIRQRELRQDTKSFSNALVYALRHDPDVIVVGEMRDLATISAALRAAETGHLVLSTLHTIDAVQAVDRIIDIFPAGQQRQVRLQLAGVIEALISQRLLPRIAGGRIAALEIVLANNVVRKLIVDQKLNEIMPNAEMSRLEGMQSMEQALADLVKKKIVTLQDAMDTSSNPMQLKKFVNP